jgi:hypothetical protein
VLIAPPADPGVWFERFSEFLEFPAELKERVYARIEKFVGEKFENLTAAALGPTFDADLLVIHDRRDREVAFEDGERVAQSVARAELIATEGLGHRRILTSPRVIESAVRFVAGDPLDLTDPSCRGCGSPVEVRGELCDRCVLAQELFDRSRRNVAACVLLEPLG